METKTLRKLLLLPLLGLSTVSARIAAAEDLQQEREEVKSKLLLPECSWSKMSKSEYDDCQKQRATMKVMTPSERARYLDHQQGTPIVVDENGRGQTIRNIGRNRPAGGGGKN